MDALNFLGKLVTILLDLNLYLLKELRDIGQLSGNGNILIKCYKAIEHSRSITEEIEKSLDEYHLKEK